MTKMTLVHASMVTKEKIYRARDSVLKIEETWMLKRKALIKGICGLGLSFLALFIMLIEPIPIITKYYTRITEGSSTYKLFAKPPIEPYMRIYLFNFTNAERFLQGIDVKAKLKQVGPFVFKENRTNTNLTVDEVRGVLRYIPRRELKFIPEMSVGDPKTINLTVPNIPYLAMTSMIADRSMWLNLGFTLFAHNLNSKPFLQLSAHDYIWGYEDKLVSLAHTVLPGWIDFPNFGIMNKLLDRQEHEAEMEIRDDSKMYSLAEWDGSAGLEKWGYKDLPSSKSCNRVAGTYEGVLLTPNLPANTTVYIYRDQMCRVMPARLESTQDEGGVPTATWKVTKDVYDCHNEDNSCYLPKDGKCLLDGFSDISPCFYDMPVAISQPHFLGADPAAMDRIEGLHPDPEKHRSFLTVQPQLGIPLRARSVGQFNVMMKTVSYNTHLAPFSNMVVPVLWIEMELEDIPDYLKGQIYFAFVLGPQLVLALEVALVLASAFIMAYHGYKFARPFSTFCSRNKGMDYEFVPVVDKHEEIETKLFVHENPLMCSDV